MEIKDLMERVLSMTNGAKVCMDRAYRLAQEGDKDPTDSLRQAARAYSNAAITIDEYLEEG